MNKISLLVLLTILALLMTSCGSHLLISSHGYRGEVEFEEFSDKSAKGQEDLEKNIALKRQSWTVLGHIFKGEAKILRTLKPENLKKQPVRKFNITTKFNFLDVVLGIFPIVSPRSIYYSGNLESEYGDGGEDIDESLLNEFEN